MSRKEITMATQESITNLIDVNISFVIPSKYQSDKECSDDMWLAYNKSEEADMRPIWVTEQEAITMDQEKTDVFVMEEFSGNAFETLKTSDCFRIVGPRCLLYSFMNNIPIPGGKCPVFFSAMDDLVVCASGFSSERKAYIQEKVTFMGGVYSPQLTCGVTHLVTDKIMSQKYETAVKIQTIKIVTIDWINAVWKQNFTKFVKATDSSFDKFKCPVFLKTFITSTDLNRIQKKEIINLVNSNGGEYMGHLDGAKTNIVITSERSNKTDKLKFALQRDIACLKYPWITDSVKAGHALPFEDYLVTTTNACSTPEKSNATLNFSSVSVIPFENHIVDESMALSSMSRMSSTCTPVNTLTNNITSNKEPYMTSLDAINITDVKKLGPFLDGCNIFLTGFESKYKNKLIKIINISSATRLEEITDNITHVLVGNITNAKPDLKAISAKRLRPHIININWLEESIKLNQPAAEECFFVETEETLRKVEQPPSPLCKKSMELHRRPQKPPPPLFDERPKENEVFEGIDLLEEYSNRSTVPVKSTTETFKLGSRNVNGEEEKAQCSNITSQSASFKYKPRDSESSIPLSQTDTISEKVFEGLTFILSGFQREEYHHLEVRIRTLGGEIVSRSYAGIPDYGVVPFLGGIFRGSVNEIVTDMFIDDCVEKEELVSLKYYHRPVVIKEDAKPLQNCVIAISTYSGQERQFLQQLAESLGALHQDTFARRTNLVKKTSGSTHLICPVSEGSKYAAAVKWNLPAVVADWLLECGNTMKFVDETPYLVGATKVPETRNIEMKPPSQTPTRTCTPVRLAALQQQETPLVNKRLSAIMNKTPQSPFHVSTPETPYGAMFKDNPSPDTRKGWVKWINNFPDLRESEPPPKRRAPSTPFSDLKRQMWDKLKGPLDGENTPNESMNKSNSSLNKSNVPPVNNDDDDDDDDSVFKTQGQTNRKLSFSDENSSAKANDIDKQIDNLDRVLRASRSSPAQRYSVNTDNAKIYELKPEIDKCMEKESQPFTVGWQHPLLREDNEKLPDKAVATTSGTKENTPKITKTVPVVKKRKFMLSGIKDKASFEKVIVDLGGEVTTETTYDSTATHLLCLKPARNEKVLCSIASGKWILHPNYIKDCEVAKKFIDEEKYEWGNLKCDKEFKSSLTTEIESAIAASAYRWRLKLTNESGGAFENMVAVLMVPDEKFESFERLIVAGNGCVVQPRHSYDPLSSDKKITHCFIQLKQKDQTADWARMASKGILCFHPQFLHNILTSDSPLNHRDNVLPEFKKYLTLLPK